MNQKMIARLLRNAANDFENDRCCMDDEEVLAIASMLLHRKLNIEQICQRYGISRATLNRWQQCGKLPQFRKDSGGKDYLWQDEADGAVNVWEEKKRL